MYAIRSYYELLRGLGREVERARVQRLIDTYGFTLVETVETPLGGGVGVVKLAAGWVWVYCVITSYSIHYTKLYDACRADAGVFNLANTLNLVLGLGTAVSLLPQLRQKHAPSLEGRPT